MILKMIICVGRMKDEGFMILPLAAATTAATATATAVIRRIQSFELRRR